MRAQIAVIVNRVLHGGQNQALGAPVVLWEAPETEEGALSAVRLVTLFRPQDWYAQTKGKVEEVVRRKWAQARVLGRTRPVAPGACPCPVACACRAEVTDARLRARATTWSTWGKALSLTWSSYSYSASCGCTGIWTSSSTSSGGPTPGPPGSSWPPTRAQRSCPIPFGPMCPSCRCFSTRQCTGARRPMLAAVGDDCRP